MDVTTADLFYENLISARIFFALHEQQQLDKQNYIDTVHAAVGDLDVFRFEDGGGDASGALQLGDDDCRNCNDDGVGAANAAGTLADTTAAAAATGAAATETEAAAAAAIDAAATAAAATKTNATWSKDEEDATKAMAPNDWASEYRSAHPAPTIQVGEKEYVLRLDTIFVLGLRLHVTKKDIAVFFSKLGRINVDELTMKPKIFVYKNKLTGRSEGEATITYTSPYAAQATIYYLDGAKFQGKVLRVLPAYLSTGHGQSIRFSYARAPEPQRRHRTPKWKPASDNWLCELCSNSNFVWRQRCNICKATKGIYCSTRGGHWTCGFCFNVNFRYRRNCNRCSAPKADLHFSSHHIGTNGSWLC